MPNDSSRSVRSVLTDVKGIGEALADRVLDRIEPENVTELAEAVNAGELKEVDGFGTKRIEALENRLSREAPERSAPRTIVSPALLARLRCPVCHRETLDVAPGRIDCSECGARFRIHRGVPDFIGESGRTPGLAQSLMETTLYARWYDFFRPFLTRFISARSLREEYALSTRLLELSADSSLLDVGCGNGNFTREFARHMRAIEPEHAGFILGLDRSRTMLREARNTTSADSSVHYVRADATSLPLKNDTFDRLHCAGSLHLMNDIPTALSHFARILRPGGVFVVATFLLGNGLVRSLAKRVGGWVSRFHWFRREELEDLLKRSGFRIEESSVAGDAITLRARRRSE